MTARRVAVIGGGWAGLAAAIEAVGAGHRVTLFEMARQPGGRARTVAQDDGLLLDNGQHILIGAYADTLRLMRRVGVDVEAALLRTPLRIGDAEGRGLYLRAGPPVPAFAAAVLARAGWSWRDRAALLAAAGGWALRRFRAPAGQTVGALTQGLPARIRDDLIDPLCVAALNTPAEDASAAVFLRVLRDALFAGRGSADLLLPRTDLGRLFATPAVDWLRTRGAAVEFGRRVERIAPSDTGWAVDGERFDAAIVAAPPGEAARLVMPIASEWSRTAAALRYEPIVTVYARSEGTRLPEPMLALAPGADAPAQFVFDRGLLGGPAGLLAFVVSGAQPWVDCGAEATVAATLAQAERELGRLLRAPLQPLRTLTEKRATFRCTPSLQRAGRHIARSLLAAGDHVDGPYPATLEGAVRSGIAAARALDGDDA